MFSRFFLSFSVVPPFCRVRLVLAVLVGSFVYTFPVAAQSSGSSLQRTLRSWGGKYVSRDAVIQIDCRPIALIALCPCKPKLKVLKLI